MSQINNQIVQSLCNSLANSVPNSVLNSVVSLTPHTITSAVQPLCCANEMNGFTRVSVWVLFPYNRFSRMFARKYNNDSNLFTHAQIRPTLFLKIFNDIVVSCYSSTERLRIACVSWKLRKVKLPGWLYEQFRRSGSLLSLTNSLKMYHASTELGTSRLSLLFHVLTNRRGDITIGWGLGIKVVSRIN